MTGQKETQIRVIIDLMKVRNKWLSPLEYSDISIHNNTTYSVIETLIAVLMDKYEINSSDIREIMIKENI